VRGRAIAAAAGFLVLVLVSVMFATSQPRERVSWLEAAVRDGLTPLFLAFNRIAETAAGVWDTAVSLKSALEENRRLQEEVEALRREVARLEEFERENAVLRRAMNLPEAAPVPVIYAEVIARPLNNWWGVVTINKGSRHGVAPQMPVVAPEGAVGYVRTTSSFTSEVILLVDPRSAVGAIVQRTGQPVLVEGMGYPGTALRLRPLTASVDVTVGDVIVTSSLSSLFPKGIPIGVVEQVEIGDFGLSVDVIVRPFVDFGALEFVSVLATRGAGEAAEAAGGAEAP